MYQWPEFDQNGDLPVGIHQGTLGEVLQHFGTGNLQRHLMGQRLERIYKLAATTEQVARFVVFGSFVTAKVDPRDVDIFLLMEDTFDSNQVRGEAAILFDHLAGQNVEGASVFWIRRQAAISGEQETVEHWQLKRDKTRRGIVEVIHDDSEQSRA
jgi:predicted nucleotidyltransferase